MRKYEEKMKYYFFKLSVMIQNSSTYLRDHKNVSLVN